MTKLIHFPYYYRLIINDGVERSLRQRYKENNLGFEYGTFIAMVVPLLERLGIKDEGARNPSYNYDSANRIAALVTEILWNDMRENNVRYLSPRLGHIKI